MSVTDSAATRPSTSRPTTAQIQTERRWSAHPLRYLSAAELDRALTLPDLTDPAGGTHAINLIAAEIITALTRHWRIGVDQVRVPPLVSVADNYDRLGYAGADVTRDSRYTRYTSPTTMLRSQTSANIPYALQRYAQPQHAEHDQPVDVLITVAGLVYRRDVVDRTHVGEPHQLDLWRLRSTPDTTESDLEEMIMVLVDAVLPGARWRTTPATHPYTLHGRQIDVLQDGQWLELAECGLIHPHVLDSSGLDPNRWSGLALGMGLDRAVMLRKRIPDIRYLRSAEPRIAAQLGDLEPWRPVSMLPPITRDLSVVIDEDTADETLGDAIRESLQDQIDDVESIEILQRTPYAQLPPTARERLGLGGHQLNALVRITVRPLQHTLTDEQANELRNRVYRAIHRGPRLELA
ncbi:hypothetical protein FOE78_21805 [Microlunatus elymi]|uniref:FDX-ACB domain-containing protein n=1 Tax=Microlunatus elymi TaxID=2596828 RepID=A0A516Q449_9ACTN|nr:hypothetical protein [Microlunatus elymi]QDP98184.1 hypothetical protein FOE78_21805 [Microlunatus elymi]